MLKSGCGDLCRNKCKTQITDDERAQIFHTFWKMGCLTQQRQYVCNTVQKNEEKKPAITKPGSRRSSTYEYFLQIQEKNVKVCKKIFLDTLDISDRFVATALTKQNSLGTCDAEKRGKQSQRANSKDTRRKRSDDTSTAFLEWKVTMQERIQQESIWKVPSVCKKCMICTLKSDKMKAAKLQQVKPRTGMCLIGNSTSAFTSG